MKIFAFESSCDDTAAAVVEDGRKILGSAVNSQIDLHRLYGGVVPELASRRHIDMIAPVAEEALQQSGLSLRDIDAVAATCAPGLIGALLVGAGFAKGLAMAIGVPFIPVHHIRGHIAANYLAFPELEPPFLSLSASGGTTLLIDVAGYTDFKTVGGTRDDAAGEVFDKVARRLGLGYPGGPIIDRLSRGGSPLRYPMPRAEVKDHPLDMSFSGLKTAAINLIHQAEQRGESLDMADFAASFSKAVADTLVPRAILAAKACGRHTLAAAGGVAANSVLRASLEEHAAKEGLRLFFPPLSLCGDNAAMVGAQAYYEYQAGHTGSMSQNSAATLSVEGEITAL